jgi:hypothetical protein
MQRMLAREMIQIQKMWEARTCIFREGYDCRMPDGEARG